MMADKIQEDVKVLKKMYGSDISVEVGDNYYVVYFINSIGKFKFLVCEQRLDVPFALEYYGEDVSKAIELLQEV